MQRKMVKVFAIFTRLKELFMILIGTIYGDADPRSVSSNVTFKPWVLSTLFQTSKKELFRVFNLKKEKEKRFNLCV